MMERRPFLELVKRAQSGDREATGQLVEENSGLIWSIARRFFGRGVDLDDLYQLGCVGFLKAVQGFDENFGTQFSTYAVPKISGEIRRFLRDDGAIKVSRSIKERASTVKNARVALTQQLGRVPTVSEVAEETGLTIEEIASCETATASAESLQREKGEDGFTLEQMLGDYRQEEKMFEGVALRQAIATLPDTEKEVVLLRYYRGLTQENCARIMNVSQVQISRLEKKSIEHLRNVMS